MLPHPLTYFEIQKYYQNKPRFNDVYSRDNLSKIKDGAYEQYAFGLSRTLICLHPFFPPKNKF